MNTTIPPGLTSIIVPCFNQVAFTESCFQGLFRHTRRPWELIAVNNGSTDGTGDYLNGIRDASAVPVTVIKNAQNRGFPAAINQGLQQARESTSSCSTTMRSSPTAGSISSSP